MLTSHAIIFFSLQTHWVKVVQAKLVADKPQRISVFFNPATKHLVPLIKETQAEAVQNAVKSMLPKKMPTLPVEVEETAARRDKYEMSKMRLCPTAR